MDVNNATTAANGTVIPITPEVFNQLPPEVQAQIPASQKQLLAAGQQAPVPPTVNQQVPVNPAMLTPNQDVVVPPQQAQQLLAAGQQAQVPTAAPTSDASSVKEEYSFMDELTTFEGRFTARDVATMVKFAVAVVIIGGLAYLVVKAIRD